MTKYEEWTSKHHNRILNKTVGHRPVEIACIRPDGYTTIEPAGLDDKGRQALIDFLSKGPVRPHYRILPAFANKPTAVYLRGIGHRDLTDDDIEEVWDGPQ